MADLSDDNIDDLVSDADKLMEDLGIPAMPDADPAIPEPDFFENGLMLGNDVLFNQAHPSSADTSFSILVTEDVQAHTSEQTAANTSGGSGPGLKYDDEQCAYDEFLLIKPDAFTSKDVSGGEMDNDNKEEDIASDKASTQSNVGDIADIDMEDDKKQDSDAEEEKDEKLSRSSFSGPSTPASRPDSTTVHLLSLPKPKIEPGRIITLNKTPPEKVSPSKSSSSTSTRVTRSGGRAKRKLSDDEDFNIEEEKAGRSTRSTRAGRKVSRLDDATSTPKRSTRGKRQAKKPVRYESADELNSSDSDNTEEDIFEAVVRPVKRKKKKGPNYYEKNKILHYEDNDGKIHEIPYCTVSIPRLTQEEIEEATGTSSASASSSPISDNNERVSLEICIDNFESAKEAVKGGANRIELCASLVEGGLTPPVSFLTMMKETFKDVPVFVMIRPRGGDFLYSEEEIEMMSRDISNFKQCGADGFVFGVLTKDCDVDVPNNKLLKDMAYPLPCTFHRAFDKVSQPFQALEEIIGMGFARILTSGQASSAHVGVPTLKRLVEKAEDRIIIMAGAGINEKNVAEVVALTGVKEVHGSASTTRQSLMSSAGTSADSKKTPSRRGGKFAKSTSVSMGATNDDVIKVTDSNLVAQILKNANQRRGRV